MSTPQDPFSSGPSEPPAWDAPPPAQSQPTYQQPTYGQPVQGYGPPPQPYGPPGYAGGYAGPPQTNSKAIIALVLAIGSFLVFPLIPAIVALVLAPGARDEIRASGGRVGGDGLVTAAKIVAWTNIGLCIAVVVLVVAAFGLFAVTGTS